MSTIAREDEFSTPSFSSNDALHDFTNAMAAVGLSPHEGGIVGDGQLHRYRIQDDRKGSQNGWYVLHNDAWPAGAFGSWREGQTHTWSATALDTVSPEERERQRQRMELLKVEREKAIKAQQAKARGRAKRLWNLARPAPSDCLYLQKKKIQAHGLRASRHSLVVPIRDAKGTIHSLQFIAADGSKKFLKGGAIQGHFITLGEIGDPVLLCEGFATGASIHEATGKGVVVAFNAGNLKPVATKIRQRYPKATIIIAADNDAFKKTNAGITQGRQAARAVLGVLVSPTFKDTSTKPTDFNDLHCLEGLDAVRAQVTPCIKPQIVIEDGELPRVVDEAEAALLSCAIYQRGGGLVECVRLPAGTIHGVERSENTLSIAAVDSNHLAEILTRAALFVRYVGNPPKPKAMDCPMKVANTYLSRTVRKLPPLTGIIESPTLRPNGSLLDKSGYDAGTGLFFDPGPLVFPVIPDKPTLKHAQAALQVLLEPLRYFPFEADHAQAVVIAAILTALIRRSLRSAPLFAFTAPKAGSGKSLLADVVGLIATGRSCAAATYTTNPEEEKKRLFSVLLAGDQVVCIDNIKDPLEGDALCSVLTQETYNDRILGVSRTATVSTATTILATGNNLQITGDLSTRVMLCSLDPKVEKPESRHFDVNLRDYIPEHRGELVQAALTLLRAYHVAGRPAMGIEPYGRFEGWSDWVRSALVWVGLPDPCLSRKSIEAFDPVRTHLANLLTTWDKTFNSEQGAAKQVTAKQVVREADRTLIDSEGDVEYVNPELQEAVTAVATVRDRLNTRSLGNYLRNNRNRIENGLRLVAGETSHQAVLWSVSGVEDRGVGELRGVATMPDSNETHKINRFDTLDEGKNNPNSFGNGGESTPRNSPTPRFDTLDEGKNNPANPPDNTQSADDSGEMPAKWRNRESNSDNSHFAASNGEVGRGGEVGKNDDVEEVDL